MITSPLQPSQNELAAVSIFGGGGGGALSTAHPYHSGLTSRKFICKLKEHSFIYVTG